MNGEELLVRSSHVRSVSVVTEHELLNQKFQNRTCRTCIVNIHQRHWVVVHIDNDVVEYFDPAGDPPTKSILSYAGERLVLFPTRAVQGKASLSCGMFCLYFVTLRRVLGFRQILQTFSPRWLVNERMIIDFTDTLPM